MQQWWFPNFRLGVESQELIKSLQTKVGSLPSTTGATISRIAFPTVANAPVTSGFGWRQHPITGERKFHTGIDFAASIGAPIYATDAGIVEFTGEKGGYGNTVIVKHTSVSTLYGHASKLYVTPGQKVTRGQMIAAVGSTGMSTEPHLHFEVRVNDKPQNPRPYLQQFTANSYSQRMRAFLATIRWAETGTEGDESYRKLVFNGTFNHFSTHPLIKQCALINGKRVCSTAAGAYQMLDKSWYDLQPKLKLTDFSPASQDKMAVEYIRRNQAIADIEAGNLDAALKKLGRVWASMPYNNYNQADSGDTRDLTDLEKNDTSFSIKPRYWISRGEVESKLNDKWNNDWLLGWRDICRSTDERTVISSIFPKSACGDTVLLMLPQVDNKKLISCLVTNLNSLTFDFVARQKVAGTHLKFFTMRQLPVLPPESYTQEDINFITPRVLELVYTAWDMQPFAQDMGYEGEPFIWNSNQRALLRAELDAYYAKLYGLTRDELRYILDPADIYGADFPSETFRVLKNNEIKQFGEYRTQRLA
ncbi:hypothetical protein NIES4071_06860 [Calothrix sp. NIES-4071]|nr:hypothetical protein NIES4071_06860 [Calothrix sp. NIES-4071]BAZ55028.1 hypothetical protein NIES4105_06820 [Calothrix sp. NIES-4105]